MDKQLIIIAVAVVLQTVVTLITYYSLYKRIENEKEARIEEALGKQSQINWVRKRLVFLKQYLGVEFKTSYEEGIGEVLTVVPVKDRKQR